MSTTFTYKLHDEAQTFREFTLRCAKITLGLDEREPLPDTIEPRTIYIDRIRAAHSELTAVEAWDDAEAARQAQIRHEQYTTEYRRHCAEVGERKQRYVDMLAAVEAWAGAVGSTRDQMLKSTMRSSLETSLRVDCVTMELPALMDGPTYKASTIEHLQRVIQLNRYWHANEELRCIEQSRWLSALQATLPGDSK
jgi:hypothetical protein